MDDDLGDDRRTGTHEDLTDTVVKWLNAFARHVKERLRRTLLRLLIREVPYRDLQGEPLAAERVDLGKDPNLNSAHREQELRVVRRVYRNETVLPFNGRERSSQTMLDVPGYGKTTVDVVFDEAYTTEVCMG